MTNDSTYYAVKNKHGWYYNGMNQFGELREARLYKSLKWAKEAEERFKHMNTTIVRVHIEEVSDKGEKL